RGGVSLQHVVARHLQTLHGRAAAGPPVAWWASPRARPDSRRNRHGAARDRLTGGSSRIVRRTATRAVGARALRVDRPTFRSRPERPAAPPRRSTGREEG